MTPLPARALRTSRVQAVLAELLATLAAGKATASRTHRIRVGVKKLRGWIRLLRFAEGRQVGVRADRDLRALARALAPARDADVRRQTVRLLRKECREGERGAVVAVARRMVPTQDSIDMPVMGPDAVARLQRVCARHPGDERLREGLVCSYRRARKLGKQASSAHASPALRHRWRRRVKYLYYQVRFANLADAPACMRWHASLGDLGTVLGELQDLHVFEQWLERLDDTSPVPAPARRAIERERRRRIARLRGFQRRCFARRQAPFSA